MDLRINLLVTSGLWVVVCLTAILLGIDGYLIMTVSIPFIILIILHLWLIYVEGDKDN